MTKEIRRISIVILVMMFAIMGSSTVITTIEVDNLRADGRNARTLYDSYSAERGPILVAGTPIAESTAVDSEFRYLRTYLQPELYAAVTGYFTLNQGNTGIEGAVNEHLSGTANDQFLANLTAIFTGQRPKGAAVELTIDPVVQQAAWDALGDNKGAIVAMDPATGAILAMVSKPAYDPNVLASHNTRAVIDAYNELLADPGDPLINRAISGSLYHPGSVFKPFMAAAAIDAGVATLETTFPNPATLQLPQSTSVIVNSSGGPCGPGEEVTLATALLLSCNIPFALLGQQMGDDLIREYTERFGFTEELRIPMRVTPSIYPSQLDEPQTMLSAFGQSDVRTTPLQMAMITAALANGGTMMKPNLVRTITAPDLSVLERFEAEELGQPVSREVADLILQEMVANVARGAASNGRIAGVDVGGKTGTAESGEGGLYSLWFTGFAPAENPQVAVAVVVEDGTSFGNAVAAPIGRQVIEAVLNK